MPGLAIVDSQPLPESPSPSPGRGGGLSIVESKPLTLAEPESSTPGFWQTMGSDLSKVPGAIWNTIRHPYDSSELGQANNFSASISPEDRAKAEKDYQLRGSGHPEAGMDTVPPPPGRVPGFGETMAHLTSPYVVDAAMLGAGEGLSEVPWGRVGSGIKAAAPDVASGAGKMAAGAVTAKFVPGEMEKIAFGGPLVYSGGKQVMEGLGKGVKAFKGIEAPPAEVVPPVPFKPNPSVARKMKFGGSSDDYSAPSYRNPPSSRFSRPPDPNEVGAPPTPITPPAASASSATTPAIPPDVQTGPVSTPTQAAGTVRTAPELTDAKRRLFATAQELDLPGHPAGTRVPGKTMSALTESVYGPGKTVSKLSPQEMGDIHDFMVRTGKLPKPGDIPITPAGTPASTASSSGSELENTLQQSLAQIERNKRLGVGTQGGGNAK